MIDPNRTPVELSFDNKSWMKVGTAKVENLRPSAPRLFRVDLVDPRWDDPAADSLIRDGNAVQVVVQDQVLTGSLQHAHNFDRYVIEGTLSK